MSSESTGEITPATTVFTMPETNPWSEAAMPRRVGKRSSVMSEIDGIAIAKPMPYTMIGTTAHGTAGSARTLYARFAAAAAPMNP